MTVVFGLTVPSGQSFSTTFQTIETPLSESGSWTNTVSGTWNAPVQVFALGKACSSAGGTGFNDSVAMLTGTWGNTQVMTAVVYSQDVNVNEVECHGRMNMIPGSPDQIHSYEFDWIPGFLQLVRWDGPQGTFVPLVASVATPTLTDGDILECSVSGPVGAVVLTAKLNGSLVQTFTDTDSTNGIGSGAPGIGFEYRTTSADAKNIGFKSFSVVTS